MAQAAVSQYLINPISAVSTADQTGKAFRFAKFGAAPAGAVDRLGFSLCGVADEPDGISVEGPLAGQAGRVETSGRLLVETGAAITAWDEIGPDSLGRAVTYPAGTGYARALMGAAGAAGVIDCYWLDRRPAGAGFATFGNAATLSRHTRYDAGTINTGFVGTLPSGKYAGQPKTIYWPTDTAGTYVLTGVFVGLDGTAYTTATAQDAGDLLDLVWTGTAWLILRNATVTMG